MAAGLKEKNWTLDDIKHILITHAHPDHIGGLLDMQQRTAATTYVHKADAPVVRGEQAPRNPQPEELAGINRFMAQRFSQPKMPVSRVDVELEDGQEVLSGWRVVHLPGHSDGQVGYWMEADRILLAGDVAMRMTGTLTRPFSLVSPDWEAVSQSIRKAADLNPDILGLGHGQPLVGDAAAKLRELANRIGA